jgi:hypothetical protein
MSKFTPSIKRPLFILSLSAVLLLGGLALWPSQAPPNAENGFVLAPPAFMNTVNAAPENSFGTVLDEQAGISAYFKADVVLDLRKVKEEFRTIELETANYVVGSVPIPNYDESHDVHVYVHQTGWVLAYYLKQDPTAKIFDWRAGPSATKLQMALSIIAGAVGQPSPNPPTYYDFRYPNATNLILMSDTAYINNWSTTYRDSFEVNLPSDLSYYEISWSLVSDTNCAAYGYKGFGKFYVNDTLIGSHGCARWKISDGLLSIGQLTPDQFHTIEVETGSYNVGYGSSAGLAIVYQVP